MEGLLINLDEIPSEDLVEVLRKRAESCNAGFLVSWRAEETITKFQYNNVFSAYGMAKHAQLMLELDLKKGLIEP